MNTPERDQLRVTLERGDVAETRRLLSESEGLRATINDPISHFGSRPVNCASKNPELMDVLLDFGADINLRSDWENGPFSVLDSAPEAAARHYIARGAILTAHAAARLGWIDELRQLLDANPAVVHEKGGDGQRPLHFAKTTTIVDLLLERGAEIDARCVDHHSTAAQYALAERPEISRYLIARGATPDIFMAARLGDDLLAKRLIASDPDCLAARINLPGYALSPPFNIYCWSLGWCLSPHEIAMKFDHPATYAFLFDHSTEKVKWLVACTRGDETIARDMLVANPGLIRDLSPQDHSLMAYSMFYGRPGPVKLMLSLGFDPMAGGVDGGSVLHIAAWHGNVEIVELLLRDYRDRIDLEDTNNKYQGTPLGWAQHGKDNSFTKGGEHAKVIAMLEEASSGPSPLGEVR